MEGYVTITASIQTLFPIPEKAVTAPPGGQWRKGSELLVKGLERQI